MRVSQRGIACQGSGVPCASPAGAGGRPRGGVGRLRGVGTCSPVPHTGLLLGAPGRMTGGYPDIISIACEGEPSSHRVGTR